jgi:capsular exopolysaccharide synthesis family protein
MELTGQEVHLSHYWNIVYKRWRVAVSILAAVMLATFLFSYFSRPLYRSTATIQIERENPNQLTVEDLFGIAGTDQEFLQTQYELLKSRDLAARVIQEWRLLEDPDFYPPGIKGKSAEEVKRIRDSMVGAIQGGSLVIEPVRNTSLVNVSYITTSARLAQRVADGVAESFMRRNTDQKYESVRQASEFLDRQIAQVQEDIEAIRRAVQQYGETKGIISANDASNIVVQRLTKINADLGTAQNAYFEKQAAFDTITRSNPETVAKNDQLVVQLNQEISRLEREYAQKLTTFLPQHPEMQHLRETIEKTKQSRTQAVLDSYGKVREAARNDMNSAAAQVSAMQSSLENQKRETMSLNVNAQGYVDLTRALDAKQSLLDQLEKRRNETQISARLHGRSTSNIHWVDHATLPGGRFNVNMQKNLQSAFPLGVILGLAAIFFLEYMDRSIKTPEELERVTRFASLGVIPAASSVVRGYGYAYGYGRGNLKTIKAASKPTATSPGTKPLPSTAAPPERGIDLLPFIDTRSPISESYRAFRTSLLLASAASPKVIVITSTFAREGKTTTSVNLATVLAQMGKPVLLIDADLRRPRLQKVFRGKMNLGLVNYLAANIPLEDVIQETQVPNLSTILSGPTPPNPSELLSSDRMKHLIHEVRTKFAYVIFDSPPVMAVTDSIVLAASADGVVLCVHGGQTPRELVQRAADKLRQSNISVLGAILNNLDLQQYGYSFKRSYYDYYDTELSERDTPPQQRAG